MNITSTKKLIVNVYCMNGDIEFYVDVTICNVVNDFLYIQWENTDPDAVTTAIRVATIRKYEVTVRK
jgi:hypothetical protein